VLHGLCQALVQSMNSAATSHCPNQQSFKTSSASLIDTFRRIRDTAGVSYTVADDSRSVLPAALGLNTACSLQSAVPYANATADYFVPSPSYLSPTGSIETAALSELQAFAGQGGMDHVSIRSPDTTDSAGSQGYAENSGIGQSSSSVATDDSTHGVKESQSSPSPSICTMCGRGCGCQKQSEDTGYQRISQEATNSWHSGWQKLESGSDVFDTYDCKCAPSVNASSLAFLSLSSSCVQQSRHSDVMTDEAVFSTPLELSITLHELSVAAREPSTGNIADLIEHTIQAVVDAHVDTCLYTSDRVATGLREYELMLSTKPPVSCSLCMIITLNLL